MSLLPAPCEEWPAWPVALVRGSFQAGNLALAFQPFGLKGLRRGVAERLSPGVQGLGRLHPYCSHSLQQDVVSSAASDKDGGKCYPHLPPPLAFAI